MRDPIVELTASIEVFPPQEVSTVSGIKFHDRNDNGQRDCGEGGLQGWTIELWDDTQTTIIGTTTTASDGSYKCEGIEPRKYIVKEVLQNGWVNITPKEVSVEVIDANINNVNFGNIQRISTNARTIGYWKNHYFPFET